MSTIWLRRTIWKTYIFRSMFQFRDLVARAAALLVVPFAMLLSGTTQAADNFLRKSYFSYREIIVVSDTGVHSFTEVNGDTKNSGTTLFFPVSSLSAISDCKALQLKTTKWQKVKDLQFQEMPMPPGHDFFDETMHLIRFTFPVEMRYDLRYTVFCREPLLLSFLSFNQLQADTTDYTIVVPPGQVLFYRLEYPEYVHSVSIDSTLNESGTVYHFRAVAAQVEMKRMPVHRFLTGFIRQAVPGIRLTIVPAGFRNSPHRYMNDWFVRHLSTRITPDSTTAAMIDSITTGAIDRDSVVGRLLAFARDKIRYINIYRGMEAFIPKDINQVIGFRMGDCKDKSNFLCQALVYKGFDARLAVCATRDHPFDMEFPSFTGGNHMVCILRKPADSGWIVLDPTNPNASVASPGYMIESATLFVFGHDEGFPFTYRVPESHENSTSVTMRLEEGKEGFNGNMELVLRGYSGDYLRAAMVNLGRVNHSKITGDFVKELAIGIEYRDVTFQTYTDSIVIGCRISVAASALPVIAGKIYIPWKIFPLVHRHYPEAGSGDLVIPYPVTDRVNMIIVFDRNLQSVKMGATGTSGDPGFSIRHEIKGANLQLSYDLTITNTNITRPLQKHFYESLSSITKCFDDVIIATKTP